ERSFPAGAGWKNGILPMTLGFGDRMETALRNDTYTEDLGRIAQDIFSAMLGLDVEPVDQELLLSGEWLAGAVHFSGAWRGLVLLECDRGQARDFAHRLMAIPTPQEVSDDVRDAVGE